MFSTRKNLRAVRDENNLARCAIHSKDYFQFPNLQQHLIVNAASRWGEQGQLLVITLESSEAQVAMDNQGLRGERGRTFGQPLPSVWLMR